MSKPGTRSSPSHQMSATSRRSLFASANASTTSGRFSPSQQSPRPFLLPHRPPPASRWSRVDRLSPPPSPARSIPCTAAARLANSRAIHARNAVGFSIASPFQRLSPHRYVASRLHSRSCFRPHGNGTARHRLIDASLAARRGAIAASELSFVERPFITTPDPARRAEDVLRLAGVSLSPGFSSPSLTGKQTHLCSPPARL